MTPGSAPVVGEASPWPRADHGDTGLRDYLRREEARLIAAMREPSA